MKSILRVVGGGILSLVGIGAQAAKHESCVWIVAEIVVAIGLALLAFELGARSKRAIPS